MSCKTDHDSQKTFSRSIVYGDGALVTDSAEHDSVFGVFITLVAFQIMQVDSVVLFEVPEQNSLSLGKAGRLVFSVNEDSVIKN